MDERRKQILAALAQMDKQFGKGSVLMLGSRTALPVLMSHCLTTPFKSPETRNCPDG